MTAMWMIRAGRNQVHLDTFLDEECVFLGLSERVGEEALEMSRERLIEHTWSIHPEWSKHGVASRVGQTFRFLAELRVGDTVATYDAGTRRYFLGEVTGSPEHATDGYFRRAVRWTHRVSRDALQVATTNSLGSIMTLFQPSDAAAEDLRANAAPFDAPETAGAATPPVPASSDDGAITELVEESLERSRSLIEDMIAALDPYQLQNLVAGVLRAMGYKTRVSPRGADRGVDIFASPDGLGLTEPRIFVEVKHRRQTSMGSQEVRSFMGGRQAGDRCLFVSTGGFTREARYEADRSSVPLTLIDLPKLRELLVEHYDVVDLETRRLIPLVAMYWPASTD